MIAKLVVFFADLIVLDHHRPVLLQPLMILVGLGGLLASITTCVKFAIILSALRTFSVAIILILNGIRLVWIFLIFQRESTGCAMIAAKNISPLRWLRRLCIALIQILARSKS
jgi:hypothetical protein